MIYLAISNCTCAIFHQYNDFSQNFQESPTKSLHKKLIKHRYHAEFFKRANTEEERKTCIRVATEWEMDISSITSIVVDDQMNKTANFSRKNRATVESDSDNEKIKSIQWFYISNQMQKTVAQICKLAAQFLRE